LKRLLFILIVAVLVGAFFTPAGTVMAASGTRSLPTSVDAGENFDVDISTADYGAFGQVVENLPAGFSYVSSTLSAAAVDADGQVVKFTLLEGDTTFRYTVTASGTAGSYSFSGTLKDEDKTEYDVGGDTQITVTAPSRPTPGGGGGGSPADYTETNLFGIEKRVRIDSDGEIQGTITATSEDGNLTITVPKGTIALDDDDPLESLEAAVDESPPDPPEDAHVIGLAYDFGPDRATFDPAITLEYTYDPDALPEGVAEENLVIAYYDEDADEWVELDSVVDTENNTITASVSHFTIFAIIGESRPAAFTLSSLAISQGEVAPGEKVNITISVANTGGSEGSCTVVLRINDVKEAEESVTIAAGSSQSVSFSVAKEEAGSYRVAVDGLSGSFTVAAPAPTEEEIVAEEEEEIVAEEGEVVAEEEEVVAEEEEEEEAAVMNWWIIGAIIAGVIVVIWLPVYFLWWRRRVA